MSTQYKIDAVIKNTEQFSSQMIANRRYIRSIKEIMGTTFKLNIKLSEEEEGIFKLFNLLNSMYYDLRRDEKNFIEQIKAQNYTAFNEILGRENDPYKIFQEILNHFSKKDDAGKKGLLYKISKSKESISLLIDDKTIRSNIKIYKDEQRNRIEQSRLLYETSLIAISNIFESLISNLIKILVVSDKNSKLQDKTLTFKQINQFGGLEEAKDYLIEKIVEDTMRGNQISWLEYIADNTSKNFYNELIGKEEDEFVDFFLKRNLIIHNNSKINKKYFNSCREKFSDQQKASLLERKIVVNEEHLLDKLGLIYVVGIKSSYYVAKKKYTKQFPEIFEFYQSIAFENLLNEENKVAYDIYNMLWKDKIKFKDSEKMLLCINYMQSLKWTGRTKELENLLSTEDFSLAGHDHKMCLYILKEDYDAAILEFKEVLNEDDGEDDIDIINDYMSWPIFKEFSLSEKFKIFLSNRGYKELRIVNEVVD